MATLAQRASAIPRQRKNRMQVSQEDAELFVAWATGEVTQAQACTVLAIPFSSRSSFYTWAASAAKFALNSGYLIKVTEAC